MWLGIAAFAGALAVGTYLTVRGGWPILAFALLGGMAAIFYVAPPIRWAYRGLGELVIALSYGPWMVLGSVYLYTGQLSWGALWASLVPGFLIMALAVVNAIPDFTRTASSASATWSCASAAERAVWLYLALARRGLADRRGRRGGARVSAGVSRCAIRAAPARGERAGALRTFDAPRALRSGDSQHRGAATWSRSRCSPPASCSLPGGDARDPAHRHPARAAARHRGSSPATATCAACTAAPSRRRASALPDELDAAEAMRVADDIVRNDVPYVMLCGGEPLVVPHFLAWPRRSARRASSSRSRPTASGSTPTIAERLARLPIRSIQISLDGDTQETYERQRPGASLAKAHAACRAVRDAGLPLEITFAPTRLNLHEAPGRHRSGARARAPFVSTPAGSCASARRRACGTGSSRPRKQYRDVPARPRTGDGVAGQAMELCYIPFDYARRACAESLVSAAGDPARAAQRLGQGGGGPAVCLRRSAPRDVRRGVGSVPSRLAERYGEGGGTPRGRAMSRRHADANSWQMVSMAHSRSTEVA